MNATAELIETTATTHHQDPDLKLEAIVIPVSDVERSKLFYERLGWRLDADFADGQGWRVVQFTPPGSPASVLFGSQVTPAAPGTAQGLYLIVSDVEAARDALVRRGVEVSEVFHGADGDMTVGGDVPFLLGRSRLSGADAERISYRSYVSFQDPDGNGWLLQEVTTRLPGRIDPNATSFASVADLASALRRAAIAHGEHEKNNGGEHDANWPDWYAAWLIAEQAGTPLPS